MMIIKSFIQSISLILANRQIKPVSLYFVVSLILSFGILCTKSMAQVPRLYTTLQGLTTSDIRNVDVDHNNIIWISGAKSLECFDGFGFHPVPLVDKKTGTEISSFVNGVVDLKDGRYLVLTNSGLYVYTIKDGALNQVMLSNGHDKNTWYPVKSVTKYNKPGYFLLLTDGWGILVLNEKTLKVDKKETLKFQKAIDEFYYHRIFVDSRNNIWMNSHDNLLYRLDLKNVKKIPFDASPEVLSALALSSIHCIIELKDKIYFGTSRDILVYEYKTNKLRVVVSGLPAPIGDMAMLDDNSLLVGTDGRGLWQLNSDDVFEEYSLPSTRVNLDYAKVKCIQRLDDGTFFLGLLQKGLMIVPPKNKFFTYSAISPLQDGINASCITSIAPGWVATDGCGMFHVDGQQLHMAVPYNKGINAMLVQDVKVDKRNVAWIGIYGGGVQCSSGDGFVTPSWMSELRNSLIMSLAYDIKSDCLFIGINGYGVYVADLTNKTLKKLPIDSILNNEWISVVSLDDDGVLWIGTASGLYYYNIVTKKGGEFVFRSSRTSTIHCIKTDKKRVYVGTIFGLVVADKSTINSKDDKDRIYLLNGERVMAIEQTNTDLWLTTSNSLVRIEKGNLSNDLDESKIMRLRTFSGVFLGEFHRNSSSVQDSVFLFGADNGIISFNPSCLKYRNAFLGDIVFSSLVIGDAAPTISIPDEIQLEHNQNSFSITFCVPYYSAPRRIRYEYKLVGYDDTWRNCLEIPQAYYSSLHSGHYTFIVRAYDESNQSTFVEKSIEVRVLPPWYASGWAYLLYFLCFLALVAFIVNIYYQRSREKKLLHIVRQNEKLKEARLDLFTAITHELRSPLTMIVSPLRQLIESEKQTVNNDSVVPSDESDNNVGNVKETEAKDSKGESRMYLYNIMMRNCNRLLNIVKQVTDIRQIDSGKLVLQFKEVDFVDYSNNIYDSFAAYATLKQISFIVEHETERVSLWLDPINFEKILTNLLSNAFKFTPNGGKIIVRSRTVDNMIELRFYNSGVTMSEDEVSHIFDRFYQGANAGGMQGSGIGLSLVAELTALHHGDVSAHSVEPDGIEFVLHFPLGKAHLNKEEIAPNEEEETGVIEPDKSVAVNEFFDESIDEYNETQETKKKHTLLMVDDDKELCQYVADQLKDEYNILLSYGGHAAWNQVLSGRPDVVVTDIRMPDGDGMELCQRIKSNPETDNIPVIMLTSESGDTVRIRSFKLKVDHFLSKPFNLLMLRGAISQAIHVRENLLKRMTRKDVGMGDYTSITITSADSKLFARINESISKHLDDSEFGVEQMAEEIGISRVHLNRKMKEHYGVSPNNFIKAYRLKQAAYLLVNNHVNISEVAYSVGFSTAAYFSSSFRSYFGMTPKDFVAQYSDNLDDETLKKLLE